MIQPPVAGSAKTRSGSRGGDSNVYRYVSNSPTNTIDANGLQAPDPWDRIDNIDTPDEISLDDPIPWVDPTDPLPIAKVDPNAPAPRNAQAARDRIRLDLHRIKALIVKQVYNMLLKTPPKPPPGFGPFTKQDYARAANAIANAYIRAVDKFLSTHPGARPKPGRRNWVADRLGWSNEFNAPWCADWATAMATALVDAMGDPRIRNIRGVTYAQYHGKFEHNFVVVKPYGYQPKGGTDDSNILIFDPWRDILPRVYSPVNEPGKYPSNPGIE